MLDLIAFLSAMVFLAALRLFVWQWHCNERTFDQRIEMINQIHDLDFDEYRRVMHLYRSVSYKSHLFTLFRLGHLTDLYPKELRDRLEWHRIEAMTPVPYEMIIFDGVVLALSDLKRLLFR